MASARLEEVMLFAFQGKFSYTMVMRRMRAFTVTSEMGRRGVLVVKLIGFA